MDESSLDPGIQISDPVTEREGAGGGCGTCGAASGAALACGVGAGGGVGGVELIISFVLLRVHRFYLACSAGQGSAGQVELIQGPNLIIARARQCVLGGDDFHVGGNPSLKTPLCLGHLFLGQLVT